MQDNRHLLPIAVVVSGALIAAAIYFGGSGSSPRAVGNNLATSNDIDIAEVTSKDHIIGSPDAKVIIVEYSDTECPYCKIFHGTVSQIMENYRGQSIAWVYRHFPIAELHSLAPKQAEATECAAEQGGNTAFWAYLNKIFATTASNNSLNPAELPRIAQSIGLDVNAFNECLSSNKYASKIERDVKAAKATGAKGTPYSVIVAGNKKIEIVGAQDYETLRATIDPLLK